MQVSLKKITKTPLEFDLRSNQINFKGFLEYHTSKLTLLKAKLKGSVEAQCSRCGEDFDLEVDEEVRFFISDGLYNDQENANIEVVESFNSIADLNELLASEIELIKSDYHVCKQCS